jgi:hypothetical protein
VPDFIVMLMSTFAGLPEFRSIVAGLIPDFLNRVCVRLKEQRRRQSDILLGGWQLGGNFRDRRARRLLSTGQVANRAPGRSDEWPSSESAARFRTPASVDITT